MRVKKAYSVSGTVILLLSLMYLGLEFIFNRQLLDISSSVRSAPQQVEHIQLLGRVASSLGFTLLVLGIFQPSGFRVSGWKQWTVFSLLALICFTPFAMTFGQVLLEMLTGKHWGDDGPYIAEMGLALIPLIGLYLILVSRGDSPFAVALGLIILACPAMFYGQKLIVERFIISPTTVEERLNAHYILLLRSGIEDCVVLLEGEQFCDDRNTGDVERRSSRAILGSFFMLNTQAVFNGLSFSRDDIINSISAQDMWFSSRAYYKRYLQQVSDNYAQYEKFLDEKYYLPYKRASDLYVATYKKAMASYAQASERFHVQSSQQAGRLEKIADDASLQAEHEIEKSWQHYRKAVDAHAKASISITSKIEHEIYARACKGHENICNNAIKKDTSDAYIDKARAELQDQLDGRFYEQTGYLPNIRAKSDFLKDPKTQREIRLHVEKKLQEQIKSYTLPPEWTYDPATFRDMLLHLLNNEESKAIETAAKTQRAWQDKLGPSAKADIEPGLSRDDFFRQLGVPPLPPLKDMILSESAFRAKYIVPMNRKIADQSLQKIKDESPYYANGHHLAEQGKDYIRILYIPAISLCVSLIIIIITLGRYITIPMMHFMKQAPLLRSLTPNQQIFIGPSCWAMFLILALALPYQWQNPYTSTKAYQKYFRLAREESNGNALLLDWVGRMQPLVYRIGSHIPCPPSLLPRESGRV